MFAQRCHQLGAGLVYETVPDPLPARGEAVIDIDAAGVNFADTLIIDGHYQEKPVLPFCPGFEVAGRIRSLGEATTDLQPGQRVLALLPHGGYAQAVAVNAAHIVPLPDNVDTDAAAALPIAYGTSYLALTARAQLRPGEVLLVNGAAGGVGLTAVEIGKRLGATVIGVARGAQRLEVVKQAGADEVVDSATESVRERVLALTGGVDVVYDPVGGSSFTDSLRVTKPGGRILVIGFASGDIPQIPANHLLVKNVAAIGFYYGGYVKANPAANRAALAQLLDWIGKGLLRPYIWKHFALADAPAALAALKERRATGKIVLTP